MTLLSDAELNLVDDLLDCIAAAMSEVEGADSAYANKTKLQKLLYLAIEEFDLPITYSWYLAGAVLPDDAATPQTLETAFNRVATPDSPGLASSGVAEDDDEVSSNEDASDKDDEDESIDPILFSATPDTTPSSPEVSSGDGDIAGHARENVVDFYISEISDVWNQNTMRFLQNFYLEYAPSDYRDFYVQSTHLRTRLRDIEEAVEAHVNDEEPATSISEQVREAGLDISDLHISLRESEALNATFQGFVAGTDLIEDCLMMVAKKDPGNLTEEHVDAMKSIQEFFYYHVWRYPCLIISQETATGPSAEALREARTDRLTDFESTLRDEIDSIEKELSDVGLRPGYTDYPDEGDEVGEIMGELANKYLEQ